MTDKRTCAAVVTPQDDPAFTHDLLVLILQHVPLQQRLGVCTRVSSAFRTAAIAATTSIQLYGVGLNFSNRLSAALEWMQHHGSALTGALDLQTSPTEIHDLMELPVCPRLCRLQVAGIGMKLTSDCSRAGMGFGQGVLQGCLMLKSLCLYNCSLLDTSEELAGLSVLQQLQELSIIHDRHRVETGAFQQAYIPANTLCHLVRLKHLELAGAVRLGSVQDLTPLTALERAVFHTVDDASSAEFAELGRLQKLTDLYFACWYNPLLRITQKDTPGLGQLTGLRCLTIQQCTEFDPLVLDHLTGLECLYLPYCTLPGGAAGTSALLAALPRLHGLRGLGLHGTLRTSAPHFSQYSSLAALSRLQHLDLNESILPASLWQYLHTHGLKLPGLTSFYYTCGAIWAPPAEEGGLLEAESFACLVNCCPRLLTLLLSGGCKSDALCEEAFWEPLHEHWAKVCPPGSHMPTNLGLSDIDDEGLDYVAASLPQLWSLNITQPHSITAAGVMQLLAFIGLRELHIQDLFMSDEADSPTINLHVSRDPQVSTALLRHFAITAITVAWSRASHQTVQCGIRI